MKDTQNILKFNSLYSRIKGKLSIGLGEQEVCQYKEDCNEYVLLSMSGNCKKHRLYD